MKQFFSVLFLFTFLWCGSLLAQDYAKDIAPRSEGPAIIAGNGGSPQWEKPAAILYDQAELVNDPGGGAGGADRSFIESALGHTLFGWGHQFTLNNSMADQFTIPSGESWQIDELTTFAYQTGATTTSTITGVYVQIWDGDPSAGGTVIWGDLTTNRMTNTVWSNIYRTTDTDPTNTQRAIMVQTSTIGTTLSEGTYWVQWETNGSLASGPWCPPRTILGQAVTGDALQGLAGVFAPALNGTSPNGAPFILTGSVVGGNLITIAEAIEDLNMDFIPDRLGDTVTVQGVVFSPNYQTTNNSFYIHDGTAGTDIFMFGPPVFTWAYGDILQITGEVAQFNGMTEIIPADSSGWVFISSGNPGPDPIVLTLADYKANPEMYEGNLVGFVSLNKVGGTWPAAGSSANLQFSDGLDTVTFRIDSDTDIDGQPEPTWPRDIIGIGSQFDSSPPYNGGYQIFPRYYATDFLPPGTIPVELTSFTAEASKGSVILNWSTATETNNSGFEVQRKDGKNDFAAVGFVPGYGTTTENKTYSFVDGNLSSGNYTYRLKQIDFDGSFSFSDEVNVDVTNPIQFELSQNYPNPFNPSTTISFTIPQSSMVTLKVFNVLGQEMKTLVSQNLEAGQHSITFEASDLNSGIYFYKLEAGDFVDVRKMTLLK